jgi:hypothetical protein
MGDWAELISSPADAIPVSGQDFNALKEHPGRRFECKNSIPIFWLALFDRDGWRSAVGRDGRDAYLATPVTQGLARLDARADRVKAFVGPALAPLFDGFRQLIHREYRGFALLFPGELGEPGGYIDETFIELDRPGDTAKQRDALARALDLEWEFREAEHARGIVAGYADNWPGTPTWRDRAPTDPAPLETCIRKVLARSGHQQHAEQAIVALARSPQRATVEALLRGQPPVPEARLAPCDGVVRLQKRDKKNVELHVGADAYSGTSAGIVDRGEVCVAEGATVKMGDALTRGEPSLESVNRWGRTRAWDHAVERLRQLLELSEETAQALADPMFSLNVVISPLFGPGVEELVSATMAEALEKQMASNPFYGFDLVPIGYPMLAAHVDPPADPLFARIRAYEAEREQERAELAKMTARREADEAAEAARRATPPRPRDSKFEAEVLALVDQQGEVEATKWVRSQGGTVKEAFHYVKELLARRSSR